MPRNARCLDGNGIFGNCIPVDRPSRQITRKCGYQKLSLHIHEGVNLQGGRIRHAGFRQNGGGTFIVPCNGWAGALLELGPNLSFSGAPFARNLKFWYGAEILGRNGITTLLRVGHRWYEPHVSLLAFELGQTCIIIDDQVRMKKLVCIKGGRFSLQDMEPMDLVDEIVRLSNYISEVGEFMWLAFNLERLECEGVDVEQAREALDRRECELQTYRLAA